MSGFSREDKAEMIKKLMLADEDFMDLILRIMDLPPNVQLALDNLVRACNEGSKEKELPVKYSDFDDKFTDGRMTGVGNGKLYRLREAILLSKRLGRPLTEDEMKEFEI